jgi:hypothetical protein
MKFTPGPWHLITTKNLRNPDLMSYLLCNKSPHCHGLLDGVSSPDADLIAAAPDMFRVLEKCLALLQDPDAEATDADKIENAIFEVINKAKGL